MSDIVVVGSFVQDFTFGTPVFPRPGQTVIGTFRSGPGGKGFNQAVAAARAGASAAFAGAVGCDPFGVGAAEFLGTDGVESHLVQKADHPTGCAAILVDAGGQNQIVVALGANESITPADLGPALFSGAKVLVTELEIDLGTTTAALRLARAAGVTTILNPAPMRADFDPSLLDEVDILIPNETEFAALVTMLPALGRAEFSEQDLAALAPDALHALCRGLGPRVVVVTLGARGCFVSTGAAWSEVAGVAGIRVVDTTGAGDAFVGAFAAGLVELAGDVDGAARFANAAAALSVTRPGTAPAMARREEIDALLGQEERGSDR